MTDDEWTEYLQDMATMPTEGKNVRDWFWKRDTPKTLRACFDLLASHNVPEGVALEAISDAFQAAREESGN